MWPCAGCPRICSFTEHKWNIIVKRWWCTNRNKTNDKKKKKKKKKLTFFHNIQKPWLFKEGPLHGKSLKMLLAFYVLATPMWKDAKEWQSCCGTKWNNPRACRYRLGSVSARPKFFSPPPNENSLSSCGPNQLCLWWLRRIEIYNSSRINLKCAL